MNNLKLVAEARHHKLKLSKRLIYQLDLEIKNKRKRIANLQRQLAELQKTRDQVEALIMEHGGQ